MRGGKKLDLVLRDVTVEGIAAEGKAIAHVDGCVLFVEYAVPGDVLDVRVIKKKKNYMEGRIMQIKKPSERRVEPFCEHFGVCGGCKWQPLPYEMQLEAKRRQVYDQLVRIGHLEVPEINPTLPSERTVRYRNKLEYTFSNRKWLTVEQMAAMAGGEMGSENQMAAMADVEQMAAMADVEQMAGGQTVPCGDVSTPGHGQGEVRKTPESKDPAIGNLAGAGFHVGKFFDKVLDIEKCHLQPEPTNAIRLYVKRFCIEKGITFYNLRENCGIMRGLTVRTNEEGHVMLTAVFGEDFPERTDLLDGIAANFPEVRSLYYIINRKVNDSIGDQEAILYKGEDAIYESMEGLRFKIGPKSFYQTNTLQAYSLYKVAREFAALTGGETVYDLYTGTGTIAQFVSGRAAKVVGIEYVPEAIADAKLNAEANGIANCEFFAGDMKDVLTDAFIARHGAPDVMIVDPPRAGMHPDVVKTILRAAPKRIVYVSCNPASQARDLEMLSEAYRILEVQPVDMFPHTQHVENVCNLELK